MSKWKCEICNKEFENFHAQGFNHKIYCPLCYFKEENNQLKDNWNKLKKYLDEDYKSADEMGIPAYGCAMGEITRIKKYIQELEGDK